MPPCDIEAERAVLGAVLTDRRLFPAVAEVITDAEMLFRQSHKMIWSAFGRLAAADTPIDLLTVRTELGDELDRVGGIAYLSGLLDAVPAVSAWHAYAQIVVDRWRLRELVFRASRVVRAGYGGDVEEVDGGVVSLYDFYSGRRTGPEWVDVADAVDRAELLRRRIESGEMPMWRCGWAATDRFINAKYGCGLTTGQVGVVGARSGVGKTIFTVDLIRRVLSRYRDARGCIWSLEMPIEDLADLLIWQTAGAIEEQLPKTGEEPPRFVLERAAEMVRRLKGRLIIQDCPGVRGDAMVLDARRLAREGFNIGVGDHLHIVEFGCPPEQLRHELGRFTQRVFAQARQDGFSWIFPAQLNREGEVGQILLKHLAESDQIGRNIDWAVGLQRAGETTDIFDLWVFKNRRGPVPAKPIRMRALWRYRRFEDLYSAEAQQHG